MLKKVNAKMYTHSSSGGESRMGDIKFHETESGLKMEVDLKDMRPGVEYTINAYKMDCGDMTKEEMKKAKKDKAEFKKMCDKEKMSVNLPTLKAGNSGKLEETFMIRGLTAKQLNNAKSHCLVMAMTKQHGAKQKRQCSNLFNPHIN